jgi:putative redox protein
MSMEITFPGGVAVNAAYKGFTIPTDQPEANGGSNSAPSPFDLFLGSLGACAGFFALRFCQQREIDTTGMKLTLETERDPDSHRVSQVRIAIHLPPDFPEKYRKAIVRTTDQCSVKRHILEPPEFEVVTA